MIIANIEPFLNEIKGAKVEIDIESIENRFNEEVENEPHELYALNNLIALYDEIMDALKKLQDPA